MKQKEILASILAVCALLLPHPFVQATTTKEVTYQSNNIRHLKQQNERATQSEGEDPCCCNQTISGFSAYDAGSNKTNYIFYWPYVSGYPQSVISLEDYSSKKLNIIANTCPDIPPIQCLKMSLGDFKTSYEKTEPYTLYGDSQKDGIIYVEKPRKTSWQTLQAWTYSTSECTGNSTGYKRIELLIVPKATENVALAPLVAVYQGTNQPATRADTKAIVNATCQYINNALENSKPYYEVYITKFKCFGVALDTANSTTTIGPLKIVYKIFVTYHLELGIMCITEFGLSALPTRDAVRKYIEDLFTEAESDPAFNELMSSYVKTRISASSPYSSYTQITFS